MQKKNNTLDYQPIYHRLSSCGPGDKSFRDTYNRCETGGNKRKVKKQIETCYIERLIYDELYKHQTLFIPSTPTDNRTQDQGHKNWLQQTFADFQTCFPNVVVKVEITEYQQHWPTSLVIVRIKNGVETKEEYTRDITISPSGLKQYDRFVNCKLITSDGLAKAKVQDFAGRSKWKKITS